MAILTVPGNPDDGFEVLRWKWLQKHGKEPWWEFGGGGTVWDSMAYDPDLDLLYIGTGNASPWNYKIRSPGGGTIFVSSIVALKPKQENTSGIIRQLLEIIGTIRQHSTSYLQI